MIVTLGSVRGSPGVTSWSLLLAAAWPEIYGVERVVVEADLDGGVLGARYGLGVEPGVASFITGLRRDQSAVSVEGHGRLFGGGVWALPGPEVGEQASLLWADTAAAVAERLDRDNRLWVIDAGRLRPGSALVPLAARSALTLLLCGSATEDLVHVPARVDALRGVGCKVGVVVTSRSPHTVGELRQFFGVDPVWKVEGRDELVSVAGQAASGGRVRRSWLWRSALELAAEVGSVVHAREREPMW